MSNFKMDQFSDEKRKEYLQETAQSLDALLNDAFLGNDQNEIRSDFPAGCNREDIKIENTKVSLAFLNELKEPQIEVVIQIGYEKVPIGEYRSVYDLTGELMDEFFYLE
jgi:hypothetical protein